jgi:hypothetical protein
LYTVRSIQDPGERERKDQDIEQERKQSRIEIPLAVPYVSDSRAINSNEMDG